MRIEEIPLSLISFFADDADPQIPDSQSSDIERTSEFPLAASNFFSKILIMDI